MKEAHSHASWMDQYLKAAVHVQWNLWNISVNQKWWFHTFSVSHLCGPYMENTHVKHFIVGHATSQLFAILLTQRFLSPNQNMAAFSFTFLSKLWRLQPDWPKYQNVSFPMHQYHGRKGGWYFYFHSLWFWWCQRCFMTSKVIFHRNIKRFCCMCTAAWTLDMTTSKIECVKDIGKGCSRIILSDNCVFQNLTK